LDWEGGNVVDVGLSFDIEGCGWDFHDISFESAGCEIVPFSVLIAGRFLDHAEEKGAQNLSPT